MARRTSPAAPTPMPALAPTLSPEPVLPPSGVVLLLLAPVPPCEEVVVSAIDDVIVLLLDVKTVTETLPEPVEAAPAELGLGPDVAVTWVGALDELSSALVEPEFCVGAVDPDAGEEVGVWPAKNLMLSPVLWGSEQMLVRLVESLNATVAEDATVQLQYEPG